MKNFSSQQGKVMRLFKILTVGIYLGVSLLLIPQQLSAHHGYANVLVLHSYDPELRWTADINRAIHDSLLGHNPEISIHVEYLDTKRNPSQAYRSEFIAQMLPKKLSGHHFELILTSDNDAFDFLRDNQTRLFADTPGVFCGVNGFSPEMLETNRPITGVTETLAIKETVDLALKLHPDTEQVVFIGETASTTGKNIDRDIKSAVQDLSTDIDIVFWNNQLLDTLEQRVANSDKGRLLFLVSVVQDRNGRVYTYAESARRIRKHARVPIYGVWDFLLGNGIVGGRLTSARAQGEMAAELGLRILNGEAVESIPVIKDQANRFMFDYNELQRFNIDQSRLPHDSVIINLPNSYYRLDKWQLWTGITIILLLTISLFLLARTTALKRKNERFLAEKARLASLDAEIGQTLTHGAPLNETLQSCLETLLHHTETSFARIWTLSENDPTLLELRASAGLFTRIDGKHRYKRVGELKIGIIARDKKPIITNRLLGDDIFLDQEWIARDGIRGFAGFPLILKDNLVGVIAFFAKHPLHEDIYKSMASVADMLAVAIDRHRAEKALQVALVDAESSRDNIDAILRSVTDGLIVTDLDKRIVLINQAGEEMLGVSLESCFQQPLSKVFADKPYQQQLLDLFSGRLTDTVFELGGKTAEENPISLEVKIAKVQRKDGSLSGSVALLHDITREREIGRMKSEFIATAAHELRTPVTTIRGYAELLANEEETAPFDRDSRQEFLGYILDKSDVLENIIDDLLDLGRVESGRLVMLDKQECEMVVLVKEIVQHHRQETDIHHFALQCPVPQLKIEIDRVKIQRVLDNLISNAVKYSPQGGTITISGSIDDSYLQVCIADEGIGLSDQELAQAFNKFYRVDPSDAATRGLGLGLTICKGIIEAHGGKIWLESQVGQGTSACFTLPLPNAQNRAESAG